MHKKGAQNRSLMASSVAILNTSSRRSSITHIPSVIDTGWWGTEAGASRQASRRQRAWSRVRTIRITCSYLEGYSAE